MTIFLIYSSLVNANNITQIGNEKIYIFTENATYCNNGSDIYNASIMILGGGASGGSQSGGGGGAGQLILELYNFTVLSGCHNITVGIAGFGINVGNNGNNGSDSIFDDLRAIGGGFGGTNSINGNDGGSGGGDSIGATTFGLGLFGYNGGNGLDYSLCYGAGGGGGCGGVGGDGSASDGGIGGIGIVSNITGINQNYCSGGNGGGYSCAWPSNVWGGGMAPFGNATTFGSAGAGSHFNLEEPGGNGFQGIVVLRIPHILCIPNWTINNTPCNNSYYNIGYYDINNCDDEDAENYPIPGDNNTRMYCGLVGNRTCYDDTCCYRIVSSIYSITLMLIILLCVLIFGITFKKRDGGQND